MPIIHAWWPSPYFGDLISAQKRAACSRGKQMRRPPAKRESRASEHLTAKHVSLGLPEPYLDKHLVTSVESAELQRLQDQEKSELLLYTADVCA